MESIQMQKKTKGSSTLDAQDEMYKRRLEQREWNQGLTVQQILDKVNDPSKFTSKRK